jgi:hypothetical protein
MFLKRSWPAVKTLVFDLDGFDLEVDADGCNIARLELLFTELHQDVRFANATIADYDQFY